MLDFFDAEEKCNAIFDASLEYINHLLNELHLEQPIVDFTLSFENNQMNARAFYVADRRYSVSLNYACYVMLFGFFDEYLHRDDYFSLISTGKKASEELVNGYLELLMDISIQLIIFHELGHVYNGHLDYLAKEKNTSTLFEVDSENLEGEDALMRQAFEWNADEFAATHLAPFYEISENCDSIFIKSPIIGYWLIFVCTVTVFSFLGAGNESEANDAYKYRTHLPLRCRVMQILESNMDCFQVLNQNRFDFNSAQFTLQDLIIELEKCCDSYINKVVYAEKKANNPYYNWSDWDEEHERYYQKVDYFFMHQMTEAIEPYSYLISSQYSCRCSRDYMGQEKYDELKQVIENSIGIEFDL